MNEILEILNTIQCDGTEASLNATTEQLNRIFGILNQEFKSNRIPEKRFNKLIERTLELEHTVELMRNMNSNIQELHRETADYIKAAQQKNPNDGNIKQP